MKIFLAILSRFAISAGVLFIAGIALIYYAHFASGSGSMVALNLYKLVAIAFLFWVIWPLISVSQVQKPVQSKTEELPAPVATGPMGTCPNCEAVIPLNSAVCPKCEAQFAGEAVWKVKAL